MPKVIRLDDTVAEVSVKRWWLTGNHVGSMYFGALAMAAELSTALQLLNRLKNERLALTFIFKDAQFDFLKRAEGTVIFHIDEVQKVNELIDEAFRTNSRTDRLISGYAYSEKDPQTKVLSYKITLSVKTKGKYA